jgi:peptide/nickel transport system substrate-binding protein
MGNRRIRSAAITMVAASALAVTACTGPTGGAGSSAGNISPVKGLATVTLAGTRPVSSVVWATTRDVKSLDAIFSYGYPENTSDSLMCESLLRQAPNGSLEPGLATVANPNPTTVVFTLRPGVKFWDGHPVTSADVVYSLDRNTDPRLGGLYTWVFDRVASISATGPTRVTITLRQPDYWLEGELSSMPGIIIEKSFAEKEGAAYGTPAGSIMCTGAYMLKSWTPGVGVVMVRNPHYWDPSVHPLVDQITIKGVPQTTTLTSGLLTGAIQGYYVANGGLPTLDQLLASSTVKVYQGPGWQTEAFFVSSLKGVLGNLDVRRALSLALNRKAIINSVYHGAALLPRWLSNPGTFGYATSVFGKAYDSSPVLTQNIAEARRLVRQAGATGKTITIGTSAQLNDIAELTGAYQAAAQAIGLKVVLRSVSAQDYVEYFVDPKFRAGVDGFAGVTYGDYDAPEAMLAQAVLPSGLENFDNFNNPQITATLEQARGTANPDQRAALEAEAEKLIVQQLPWIPDVQPTNVLLLSKGLTGAVASMAYMFAPWANRLGGTG